MHSRAACLGLDWPGMNSTPVKSDATPRTSISFRNMDRSPALAERIEHEIGRLRRYVPGLEHCEVMVEALHRHHRFGHPYQVHLVLRLPGIEVVVTHEPSSRQATAASAEPEHPARAGEVEAVHRDAYVAVRDAFDLARRRLEEEIRRMRDRRRANGALSSPRNAEPGEADSDNLLPS